MTTDLFDRREHVRCRVQLSDEPAILRIGSKNVIVTLRDESSGGFTLMCDSRPKAEVGQIVKLASRSGFNRAEVVHVTHVDDGMQIGLKRLGETDPFSTDLSSRRNALLVLATMVILACALYVGRSSDSGWMFMKQEAAGRELA